MLVNYLLPSRLLACLSTILMPMVSYVMIRTDHYVVKVVVSLVTGRLCGDIWIVPAFFVHPRRGSCWLLRRRGVA